MELGYDKKMAMAEHESEDGSKRQIFIYMDDWPYAHGSGAHLRFHSNVAAWVDCGWRVTVVRVAGQAAAVPVWPGVEMEEVLSTEPETSIGGKMQYRLGYAGRLGCGFYFAKHRAVYNAVTERHRRAPWALHQLEGDSLGNAAPFLRGIPCLFSHHDLSADAMMAIYRMAADLEGRKLSVSEKREIGFMAAAEKRICRASRVLLCISDYDRQVLASRFGLTNAFYLPMSVTPEEPVERVWERPGYLRLLHVGKINHLPTYRSLENLLGEVFPRLRPETLARLRLRVAGRLDEGDPKCRRILALWEPYRECVEMVGFVADVSAEYARADLQVVASTEVSGLRTRIVESMAWGVPVLSTVVAARGIGGLEAGRNILLAEDAVTFAAEMDRLVDDGDRLRRIAEGGLELYRTRNSRAAVAKQLAEVIARYYPAAGTPS
jgi:glycosyltransferase involved in cell wall biosynthesis